MSTDLAVDIYPEFGRVEVLFDQDVGSNDLISNRLWGKFEALYGVETVRFKRYSVAIEVAPHVIDPYDLAEQVAAIIRDDGQLQDEFEKVSVKNYALEG